MRRVNNRVKQLTRTMNYFNSRFDLKFMSQFEYADNEYHVEKCPPSILLPRFDANKNQSYLKFCPIGYDSHSRNARKKFIIKWTDQIIWADCFVESNSSTNIFGRQSTWLRFRGAKFVSEVTCNNQLCWLCNSTEPIWWCQIWHKYLYYL